MPLENKLTPAEARALEIKSDPAPKCAYPGCTNVAEHVLGVIRDISAAVTVCTEHIRAPDHTKKLNLDP